MTALPRGFASHVANIGVKDDTDDFVVVAAGRPVPTAALFTKSRFAGPSVELLIPREKTAAVLEALAAGDVIDLVPARPSGDD